jgi:hypothetical protein
VAGAERAVIGEGLRHEPHPFVRTGNPVVS